MDSDSPPPKRRRRWIIILLLAAAGVAVWGAFSARVLLEARADANAGRSAIDRVRASMAPADLVQGKPLEDLRIAREFFERAHERVTTPLLAPMRFLPVLGRQLRSAVALTDSAAELSDIGIGAVTEAKAALELPRQTGPQRVALLRRLAELSRNIELRVATLDLGPDEALVGPLATARRDIAEDVAELRSSLHATAAASAAAADLLAGPRRMLLFAANNAEMRAGSGMFLAAAELQTHDGTLNLTPMRSIGSVPLPEGVPLKGDLADRWGWAVPNREWTALMMSPRFPSSAELASRMWQAIGGGLVDGVISVDPVALSAVLDATGPIVVDGRSFDSNNVVPFLLHDQYEDAPSIQSTAGRRDLLGSITAAAFAALNEGRWDPVRLISRLADATTGRHLTIWSSRAEEQPGWIRAGVAGELRSDSLHVAILNRGANKLDWFLRTEATIAFTPGALTQATLTIRVKNETPSDEPSYIAGAHPDSGGRPGDYVGVLAVNLPGGAGGSRIDGVDKLGIVGADGPTRVVGTRFVLPRGEERTFVVRFSIAGDEGAIRVEPSARIPPTTWRYGGETWTDSRARLVEWKIG